MGVEIIAKIRRFVAGKAGMSPIVARATGAESLAVAQVDPYHSEITRAGRSYTLSVAGATTGRVSVVAQVTTVPQWSIWNNDSSKAYVFSELGAMITSGVLTAGSGIIVQAAFFQAPARVGANTANMVVTSLSNGGPASKAIVQSQATALTITTPAAPVYYTVAKSDGANIGVTTNPTIAAINEDLEGCLILPPQWGLAINVYTTATGTPLFVPHAVWQEIELDLE